MFWNGRKSLKLPTIVICFYSLPRDRYTLYLFFLWRGTARNFIKLVDGQKKTHTHTILESKITTCDGDKVYKNVIFKIAHRYFQVKIVRESDGHHHQQNIKINGIEICSVCVTAIVSETNFYPIYGFRFSTYIFLIF